MKEAWHAHRPVDEARLLANTSSASPSKAGADSQSQYLKREKRALSKEEYALLKCYATMVEEVGRKHHLPDTLWLVGMRKDTQRSNKQGRVMARTVCVSSFAAHGKEGK